jgi:molybdate transport system substrate-binding protein
MHFKALSILLLFVLLLSACTPMTSTVASTGPTQAPAPASAKTLTVMAAASLTESFTELGKLFETQNPGVKVIFSFAGSQQLAQQLDQGAAADVFASASKKYMDAAVKSNRINDGDAKTFVKNRLVVIFPKDNPAGITTLKDLAKPGLKLDLAAQAVPVGQYSLDFLDKAVNDPGFDAQYKDNVLKNVVSYEENVKAVVNKVSLGEADAGIVYVTDITRDASAKVGTLDIPDALNTIATYPIAPISDSKNPDLAKAFVALVLSPDGQAVLAKYGFLPAAP